MNQFTLPLSDRCEVCNLEFRNPSKEVSVKLFLQIGPAADRIGWQDANQEKVDLDSDRGNSLTFRASLVAASPACAKYWLMCSIVDVLSWSENLEKSGIL
jgi:hypothetical protein